MNRRVALAYVAIWVGFLALAIWAASHAPGPDPRDRNTINGTWPYRLNEALER